MRFASAFAVSYWMDRSTHDGILGLGLSQYVETTAIRTQELRKYSCATMQLSG
ncbi:hypothetical protein FKP32DRAFT_1588793 [Trametes sanguinea]|nr:hypothetical protein FKP32DRAFT_1588793 [Trametes sanguinea]